MQFRILGPCSILDEATRRQVRLTSPKQRLLLGALLLSPGTPVPADQLIKQLWGGSPPDRADNALQAHVSRLRQALTALEPAGSRGRRLTTRSGGYVLHAGHAEVDSTQFRLGVARARRVAKRDPRSAYALLHKALNLWRGPALDGAGADLTHDHAAAQLDQERLNAVEDLHDLALRLGLARQVVGRLEELAAVHPERERLASMLALAQERADGPTRVDPPVCGGRRPGGLPVLPGASSRPLPLSPPGSAAGREAERLRERVEELWSELGELTETLRGLRKQVEQLGGHTAVGGAPPPHAHERRSPLHG
jgi:DNA-binding SARP family transcriptional activator